MSRVLPVLLFFFFSSAQAAALLRCELIVSAEQTEATSRTEFSVTRGKPQSGEFLGYEYYLTYQETTARVATYQISHENGFFLHGSSLQPEAGVQFSGLGRDSALKNRVYLGCESGESQPRK